MTRIQVGLPSRSDALEALTGQGRVADVSRGISVTEATSDRCPTEFRDLKLDRRPDPFAAQPDGAFGRRQAVGLVPDQR